ncbi:adenylate/guanylate cyclase domain-containing protein [uncultured Roseobacter sp.]|uniref:CHASE2 domain-containing protein n=1 Tax=uncultured Roseobacter sp. TaxID=114847 RepID=UPI0026122641|nr:adenylate/guanylate cyclase domain-containing protein [uncultured Roseobacter sp.]
MALIGLLLVLAIRVGDPLPVSSVRNASFDLYHQSKPRTPTALPVSIIDIDDRSVDELGQWPWPRSRLADLVTRATAAGATVIGFDIVFPEPDRMSLAEILGANPDVPPAVADGLTELPDQDALLAEAMTRARVVVGQASVRTEAGNRIDKRPLADAAHALLGPDPSRFLMRFPDAVQNVPPVEAAATGRGVFSTRPDTDGIYRRVPLVMQVQGQIRLGLAPEVLRIASGGDPFVVRSNAAGVEGILLARQLVPTASDGTVWPYLTPSLPGRYVSATDLLNDRMPAGRLNGHLVLVGTSAIGLEDFRPTPLGVAMAGVEIHAQVLENIMTGSQLLRPNHMIAVELVTTAVLCLLVILFAPATSGRVLIGSAVVLLGGYVSISYWMFAQHRLLLDPTFPVFATTAMVILLATVNYLREERQRREIRHAFGQYVSPDLVDRLSEKRHALTLGGESRELTLLFSDVHGFTAIAEEFRDDPQALTHLMNRFLTILSQAILAHKGTIDKFMGDAVMAFWNAPLDHPAHADAACRAALRMIADVEAFNTERQRMAETSADHTSASGVLRMDVGIGINTGRCVVGNMGSDTRFDYTALGDPVNVASRLEGQSRTYGAAIILGQNTARLVQHELAVLELDVVRVVGKAVPERIFALLGGEELRQSKLFNEAMIETDAMLKAYRRQDWDAAAAALPRLKTLYDRLKLGLHDTLALYERRVSELRAEPPGPGWDGVFASTGK